MKSNTSKIAVVTAKYGLVGGGERFVQEVTERIAANPRYEIHVLANQWKAPSERITFHKIPIISFPRFLKPLSFAWFVNRKLNTLKPDLIHTHERIFRADVWSMHGIPHRIWAAHVRKKAFLSLFDLSTAWVETRMIASGRIRRFFPVSTLTKQMFLEEFPINPEMVRVLHPGVDVNVFGKDRGPIRRRVRKQFGIAETDIVIVFVGMNFEIKGLNELIAAVSKINCASSEKPIKLMIAGKGNFKKYELIAERLGIKNDIIFTGVWESGVEDVYLSSDVFAMLSQFDTFGMAVLEAMAASLPVIVSDRVGAKDLVMNGQNGFVVERDDVDGIASKLSLLLNSERRILMGEHARQTALLHQWEQVASTLTQTYENLLKIP